MYFTKKIIAAKNQPEKIWLYDRGNEFTATTGGWNIIAGATKAADYMRLVVNADKVETANDIVLTNQDRIFVTFKKMTSGSQFFATIGTTTLTTNTGSFFYNLNQTTNEVTGFWGGNNMTTGKVRMNKNLGEWRIYQVWIEKYNN